MLSPRSFHEVGEMPKESFRERWLEKFALSPDGWRGEAEAALEAQAFGRPAVQMPLLDFLFGELGRRVEEESRTFGHVAEAFAFCCFQFFTCKSHFPLYAHGYAEFLAERVKGGDTSPGGEADVRADLLLGTNVKNLAAGGFNPAVPKDRGAILDAEHIAKGGKYEEFLTENGRQKVEEYERRLPADADFARDWELLRNAFPGPSSENWLRRTKIPERNWVQGAGANFGTEAERFQAFFDLFCWKYFLWGMQEGKPLLQRPYVAYTPYGTQLFIPGY